MYHTMVLNAMEIYSSERRQHAMRSSSASAAHSLFKNVSLDRVTARRRVGVAPHTPSSPLRGRRWASRLRSSSTVFVREALSWTARLKSSWTPSLLCRQL
ncbi:hypothetical protein PsYK624_158150 [Phanerochaete sordida]|uniref:Uncharacterized protein n=1 Tax=Phanerochaete sordida TaxID=48140 RepID=A0A9P3GR52_9APHY|nr:hypothetical protein PsYK624_158150 [Phanerochaete sordida]